MYLNKQSGLDGNLWMQHDLEEMVSNAAKKIIDLPEHIKDEVLNDIVVLLVTININETLAVQLYLQNLDDHDNVYKFIKDIDLVGQKIKYVTFYIGKYGVCPAAIGVVPNEFEMHGNLTNFTVIAYECFPNLSTIVSVGIANGIQNKVKICDVLVSSNIVYFDKENEDHKSTQRKTIDVSNQLIEIFKQPDQWPHTSIQERLEYNKIMLPHVKSGVILSGLHLIDDSAMKSENTAPNVIGNEMEGAHIFRGALKSMANIIIVKAVCGFEIGKYNETYQPTAALLAANLVYSCLNNSQVKRLFTGLVIILTD